jgi:transposase
MSLPPSGSAPIPEETARLARAISPKGTVYMQIRDQLGVIYEDHSFAALFSTRGQPAEAPWRLMLVCIFQFIEGLTDRQAAEAVQQRIDWKYALALELSDPGFDFSVLSKFRARVVAGGREMELFEILLDTLKAHRLLKARGRQRTDSTPILAAVRMLNRLERVGETLRHALNSLAEVAPEWLQAHAAPEWYDRYGRRMENYRFPKAQSERDQLGQTIGQDGLALLTAIDAAADLPHLRALPAIEILRQVWAEQYTDPPGPITFRDKKDLGSAADLIVSPYDTEARFSTKRGMDWIGYKVHFTETCDEENAHLITHVETTHAAVPDDQILSQVHEALASQDLLPQTHLVDAGYTTAKLLVDSQHDYAVTILGPMAHDASWQAKAAEGFDRASFVVDWEKQTVTCPAGKQNYSWLPYNDPGKALAQGVRVQFASRDCTPCPLRSHCTKRKSTPRELLLQRREEYEALQLAKQHQTTEAFRQEYALRAGIEATHAQGLHRSDLRQTRYIGLARTRLQHLLTAIALNLVRAVEWLSDTSHAQTPSMKKRQSHFAALEQAIA